MCASRRSASAWFARHLLRRSATGLGLGLMLIALAAGAPAGTYRNLQMLGDVSIDRDELLVAGKSATCVFGEPATAAGELLVEFSLAEKGAPALLLIAPQDAVNANLPAVGRMNLGRDKDGCVLTVTSERFDNAAQKWQTNRDPLALNFWPPANVKNRDELMAGSGIEPRTWHGRRLRMRAVFDGRNVCLWLEGLFLRRYTLPDNGSRSVALQLSQGDRLAVASVVSRPAEPGGLYLPVDLNSLGNDRFSASPGKSAVRLAAVPFELPQAEQNQLSLTRACWIEEAKDPGSYYERYDAGAPVLGDPRMPMLRVPSADYVAAHLLAACDDDPQHTSRVTLRAGRYGYSQQVVQYDFFAQVPRRSEPRSPRASSAIDTPAGPLFAVRVPMDTAFAQDVADYMDLELTKEIRLARRQPDPARFRYRPLGLPSGVRIAAITLERSPLQMRVGSRESGHAFVEPQWPEFQVRLENITRQPQSFHLQAVAAHRDQRPQTFTAEGRVEPGQSTEVALPLAVSRRGYYDLAITLADGSRRKLLTRHTSFAVLPPETRQHRSESPFGTWDFCGGHFTCSDADRVGPLYVKMGLRYGMFNFTAEERARYGVLPGNEAQIVPGGAEAYAKVQAKHADALPNALIFHEHGISGRHMTRAPDLFRDGPPFALNAEEQQRFQTMFQQSVDAARSVRAKYPQVRLSFGNGALPTKEEFYRNHFPAELFDAGGNESASFCRMPETQPPDMVANNASIWMDRQMLDAYGYRDKGVTQCYEVGYPCTSPGNLDPQTQSDYFVRHAIHALAWGVPRFRPGCISDVGNSYRFSNWGSCGFCRMMPELNVKPAFVALATMTRVLDGARFERALPCDSGSVYVAECARPDGAAAYVIWTLRGRRPLTLSVSQEAGWTAIDDQSNESQPTIQHGRITITATPTPTYLVGRGRVSAVQSGTPVYAERPEGKAVVLDRIDRREDWTVEADRNAELEYYNPLTPRRKGDFRFQIMPEQAGRKNVLGITPQPIRHGKDTMPMYAVLAHRQGISIPGTPTEIGLWVHGNSGWGRLMFELVDASGQRWISLGAQQAKEGNVWLEDAIPKDMLAKFPTPGISDWNTEDPWGASRINFDGWRWVAFPLPGNYPGEGHPWPGVSQWRWDKDGKVHYPLKFTRLIVELQEKTLHFTQFKPVEKPAIYASELTVGNGDVVRLKTNAGE